MDWDVLRVFLEVARRQSFRSASQILNISQPTVSRKIQELEYSLGAKLFVRRHDGIMLTHAGRRILPMAEEMDRLAERISAQGRTHKLRGRISLWVSDGIGGYWLPWLLEDFHENHPEITLDVTCRDVEEYADLSKLDADITVTYRYPEHPDVCVLAESSLQMALCASNAYVSRHGAPEKLEDLVHHRVCAHKMDFREPGGEAWDAYARVLAHHDKVVYVTNSSLALGFATKYGGGISLQPVAMMEREPNMTIIEVPDFDPTIRFWLICHKDVKDDPRVRVMVNYLKKNLFMAETVPGSMSRKIPRQRRGSHSEPADKETVLSE